LIVLAVAASYQGIWAQLWPRSFYDDFPGGAGWLVGAGPYNEHFVRDIGGLVNGLAVVAVLTAWSLAKPLVIANALSWLTYAVPHLIFHVVHPLDGPAMQVPNVAVLSLEVLLPLLGLVSVSRHATSTRSMHTPGPFTPVRASRRGE
jgi:hypothetical protein